MRDFCEASTSYGARTWIALRRLFGSFSEIRFRFVNAMIPVLVALLVLLTASPATPQDGNAQRGRALLQDRCAQCHAIEPVGASPLPIAPPFRELHKRYPVEHLAEAFAEGIVTGHPTMPEFTMDPGQIGDVIAYLKTLEC
jgi:mono/diheme cytochrome c family protein